MKILRDNIEIDLASGALEQMFNQLRVKSMPTYSQQLIAEWYGIDAYEMNNETVRSEAKYVYGYVLYRTGSRRCFYDCAYDAGVRYERLTHYVEVFDNQRNEGTSFGRELDVLIAKHVANRRINDARYEK